jgi:hypothetical protein
MKRVILPCALLALTFALPLPTTAANLTRTFVSSSGVDSNPCTVAAPCATFAAAYAAAVAANGIVAALDPGKYGPLTITTDVTINGNGWAAITGPAENNAITINAGSGNVTLTGLEIDGARAAYNGIVFNSGSSLTVTNCIIQNFIQDAAGDQTTGDGILIQAASGRINITIANTILSDNDYLAIWYNTSQGSAAATGVIDHVTAVKNSNGILIVSAGGSTTSPYQTASLAIATALSTALEC